MAERGIDISTEYPKPWTDEVVRAADVVITMGCGDACPVFPGKRYEEWVLDDPAGLDVDAVRPIRDEIERRVHRLLAELDVTASSHRYPRDRPGTNYTTRGFRPGGPTTMSDPHVPRHPLATYPIPAGPARRTAPEQPTATRRLGHRAREFHDPNTTAHHPRPLSPRQYKVLQAVADQRIHRDTLLGTLEPHLLDGEDVIWTLRALVLRGLVQLQPIGPPRLTPRGRRTLDSPD